MDTEHKKSTAVKELLMGDFTLSSNASIGLTSVEYSAGVNVNSSSSKNSSILYTTPTSVPETNLLQQTTSRTAMQDAEFIEKTTVSSPSASSEDIVGSSPSALPPVEKGSKECDSITTTIGNGLIDKLSDQVPQSNIISNSKSGGGIQLGGAFHVSEASCNVLSGSNSSTAALWSSASCGMEDGYMHNMQPNVNGGLTFQNFIPFNNSVGQGSQVSNRRAITASHNFPHSMGRQQGPPSHPLYKGYSAWANPQQQGTWSSGATAPWNRGRSVPNLNPMQQIGGLVNRKPSPTFSHQHSNMVISPVKFRRSTSYPGKGIFAQPPTFEITNMDDNRDMLPYQVILSGLVCRVFVGPACLPIAHQCTLITSKAVCNASFAAVSCCRLAKKLTLVAS